MGEGYMERGHNPRIFLDLYLICKNSRNFAKTKTVICAAPITPRVLKLYQNVLMNVSNQHLEAFSYIHVKK